MAHALFALITFLSYTFITSAQECNTIYVRWPRVKLTFRPRVEGPYSNTDCREACTKQQHPARRSSPLACAGFNHKQDANNFAHDCEIYQSDQLQNVDGNAEADDRYSFYWRYCVKSDKKCSNDYQFTFYTDRYMDKSEIARLSIVNTLEECLAKCLDETDFTCRSVSFNRTDGGCHLSAQNQLSKPRNIRLNNNPNFRIDYYESNCYNNSFEFEHECRSDGIVVKVDSKFAYTGALYGLYDYFTCRIEPVEQRQFQYFFPSPTVSKNCSDSIRYKDGKMILEVVLSTDGVEPLYFITAEDLTYQARCEDGQAVKEPKNELNNQNSLDFVPFQEQPNQTTNVISTMKTSHEKRPGAHFGLYRMPRTRYWDVTPHRTNNNNRPRGSKITIGYKLPGFGLRSNGHHQQNYVLPTPSTVSPKSFQLGTSFHDVRPERQASTNRKGTRIVLTYKLPGFGMSSDKTKTTTIAYTERPATAVYIRPSITDRYDSGVQYLTLPTLPPRERVRSQTIDLFNEPETTQRITKGPTTTRRSTTTEPTTTTTTTRRTTTQRTTTPSTTTRRATQPTTTRTIRTTASPPVLPPRNTVAPQRPSSSTSSTSTSTSTTKSSSTSLITEPSTTATRQPTTTSASRPILFDVFNGGTPVQAVVVGTRVTLSFTPFHAIPPSYMTIAGCQVEPVGSQYEWEREPLPIIKDGCQADSVGLICPPERTNFGIRVKAEAFRYQSTAQVQYTCMVRVCPFAPCPQAFCPPVEGCASSALISSNNPFLQTGSAGSFLPTRRRQKRQFLPPGLPQVPGNFPTNGLRFPQSQYLNLPNNGAPSTSSFTQQSNPFLQVGNGGLSTGGSLPRANGNNRFAPVAASLQEHLIALGGDHIVKKTLIVVNSENELQYYLRTGNVPSNQLWSSFIN